EITDLILGVNGVYGLPFAGLIQYWVTKIRRFRIFYSDHLGIINITDLITYIRPCPSLGVFPQRVVRKIIGQFQNPCAVTRKVKIDIPIPVGRTDRRSSQGQLYPTALQQARIDIHGGITSRRRYARAEYLVLVFHHIIGSCEVEPVVKPSYIQSSFIGPGYLRLQERVQK